MNKTFYFISMGTIILALCLLLMTFYWLLYPYKTIEFTDEVAKVEMSEVERGEHQSYTINYCKYTSVDADISRSFVDGIIYLTPDGIADVEEGCGSAKIQVYIPRAMPAGEYRIMQVRHYQVNPLREITIKYFTEKFKVL